MEIQAVRLGLVAGIDGRSEIAETCSERQCSSIFDNPFNNPKYRPRRIANRLQRFGVFVKLPNPILAAPDNKGWPSSWVIWRIEFFDDRRILDRLILFFCRDFSEPRFSKRYFSVWKRRYRIEVRELLTFEVESAIPKRVQKDSGKSNAR